jgi:hypothetical protein
MKNTLNTVEAAKRLSQNQKSIIKTLFQFGVPVTIEFFDSGKAVILNLQDRGFVSIQNEQVSLTTLGVNISEYWQNQKLEALNSPKVSLEKEAHKQQRLEKSNEFLELYKQGLNYQDIGDKYGISRERVRQILNPNVEFRHYLRECEKAKIAAEEKKKEQTKQNLYSRSLAALYPERVTELWDYDKNGDLKPEQVLAGSTQHCLWFKCSEGHSWNKKPSHIVSIWRRNGTSGCPMCAGRKKKAERQPFLVSR